MVSPPTNTSIQILAQEVLANARAIPSIRGGGAHGHLGLVMTDAIYHTLTGSIPFMLPAHPGDAPTPPAAGATQFEIAEQIRIYKATIEELTHAATLHEELKKQILGAVNRLYLTILEDATFGFATVSVADMIAHLQNTYGTLTRTDLEKNRASISSLWTPSEPIELLWDRLREVQRIAAFGNEPISDAAIVELTHLLFETSGVFAHTCETWLAHPANQRTYAEFQIAFTNANKQRLHRLTTSQARFHSANAATTTPACPTPAPSPRHPVLPPAWSPPTMALRSIIVGRMALVSIRITPAPPAPTLLRATVKQPPSKTCVAETTPSCPTAANQKPPPLPRQQPLAPPPQLRPGLPMLREVEGSR